MSKESVTQIPGVRERHLNIVYFIDSSRSHSVRINLTAARWILAGTVGLALWSLLSVGWIISLDLILDKTRGHLNTTLTSLFNYQVKYDKIFDVAYPENSTHGYYAEGSHLPNNNPIANDPTPATEKKPAATTPAPNVAAKAENSPAPTSTSTPVATTAAATAAPTSNQAASTAFSIDIKKPTLTLDSGNILLTFDIFNKDPKVKAEGYIWAIGTLQLADGSTKTIVAPSHAKLGSSGDVSTFSTTYRFSIQRYKLKDFSFAAPAGEGWKLTHLKIVHVDLHGKQKQEVSVPIQFQKSAKPTAASEQTTGETDNVEGE